MTKKDSKANTTSDFGNRKVRDTSSLAKLSSKKDTAKGNRPAQREIKSEKKLFLSLAIVLLNSSILSPVFKAALGVAKNKKNKQLKTRSMTINMIKKGIKASKGPMIFPKMGMDFKRKNTPKTIQRHIYAIIKGRAK